jgi:hypothetical protein
MRGGRWASSPSPSARNVALLAKYTCKETGFSEANERFSSTPRIAPRVRLAPTLLEILDDLSRNTPDTPATRAAGNLIRENRVLQLFWLSTVV